jgi:hypothetical protein
MAYMRGLELVCIARTHSFEIRYEHGRYLDPRGREVEGLLDLTCFACSAAYYTLEDDEQIDFCPSCGRLERMAFADLASLLQWSRGQDWGFLRFSARRAFAVVGASGSWELRFAVDEDELRRRGVVGEVHSL